METNIPDILYYHNLLGYDVVCSQATVVTDGRSQGEVRLVSRERPKGWNVESTQFHVPNIVRCKIVSNDYRMYFNGEYLPPSTLDHLTDLE